jgi:hypothetical protein
MVDAWTIQGCIKHDMTCRLPQRDEAAAGYTLREKVNDALLRFADEDLTELELDVTEEELWLIDQKLPLSYDGARAFLLRVFKALWELDYQAAVGRGDGFLNTSPTP